VAKEDEVVTSENKKFDKSQSDGIWFFSSGKVASDVNIVDERDLLSFAFFCDKKDFMRKVLKEINGLVEKLMVWILDQLVSLTLIISHSDF
jgi:hypothetical protein